MKNNYNRRDFAKAMGATVGAVGLGSVASTTTAVAAGAGQATISAAAEDKLASMAASFATKVSQLVNRSDESVMPIYMGVANLKGDYYRYSSDPTVETLELAIAALENAQGALATSSGMTAITQTLLGLLKPGDTILFHQTLYAAVQNFIRENLTELGINAVEVDMRDLAKVERLIAEHKPEIVYFEPYTNPQLEVIDIEAIVNLNKANDGLVVIDNTFMSPLLIQPLDLGCDLVIHSMTKYIGGHGDALAGVVAGRKELLDKILVMRYRLGGNLAPEKAYLMLRGLRTLALRMPVHSSNAFKLARWLEKHPKVKSVNYPGLESNVGHEIAKRQAPTFGGMVSFVVEGGSEAGNQISKKLRICKDRSSLGEPDTLVLAGDYVESLFSVAPGFVRIAVGLEGADDLIRDFEQALA